jgi:hypothetical protein
VKFIAVSVALIGIATSIYMFAMQIGVGFFMSAMYVSYMEVLISHFQSIALGECRP